MQRQRRSKTANPPRMVIVALAPVLSSIEQVTDPAPHSSVVPRRQPSDGPVGHLAVALACLHVRHSCQDRRFEALVVRSTLRRHVRLSGHEAVAEGPHHGL